LRDLADQLWGSFTNAYDYAGTRETVTAESQNYHDNVINSTVYRTDHPIVQVHPITGERALILGNHLDKLIGLSAADSKHLFDIFEDHITKPENTVRWRWTAGDVAIWESRDTAQSGRRLRRGSAGRATCGHIRPDLGGHRRPQWHNTHAAIEGSVKASPGIVRCPR